MKQSIQRLIQALQLKRRQLMLLQQHYQLKTVYMYTVIMQHKTYTRLLKYYYVEATIVFYFRY